MLSIAYTPIDPVAFPIGPIFGFGPIEIRWYALAYLAGFIGGWLYCARLVRGAKTPPRPVDIGDFVTWAVIGTILGGRLGYVLIYEPETYLADPLAVFAIWEGGMAFHGGLVGVILAVLLFARVHRIDPFVMGDLVAAATPIGLFFGRIANFVNNELWGRPTDLPWGVVFPIPPQWQDLLPTVPRHPSQLYEAALEGLVLFVILAVMIRRPTIRARPGIVTGTFLVGYGVARFLVEFVRQYDPREELFLGVFTTGQLLSIPMAVAGAAIIAWAVRRRRPEPA